MFEREKIPIELHKRRTASRWWLSAGAVVVMLAWAAAMVGRAAIGQSVGSELPPFIAGMLSGIVMSFVVRAVLRRRVDASSLQDVDSVLLAANGAGLILAAMVEFVEMLITSGGA